MVRTRYLSETEKAAGQKRLYRAELWNGIGYSMLGDTIVYILAVRFGASNISLGYIASAMYIVGILLPVMPRLLKGLNIVKVQAWTWAARGLVCIPYLFLLILKGEAAVFLLLSVYTLFCCVRLVGVVLYDQTYKSLTTSHNRSQVLGTINVSFQSSTILAKFINFVVTSIQSFAGMVGLVTMQMVGVACSCMSAYHMAKIPCRSVIEYRKGRNILMIFKETMAKRDARVRLLVSWTYTTVTVVISMIVPFLTKEVGLPANLVFLFSMGVGASVVLAGSFCKFFGDKLGSRPLIIWSGFALLITLLAWIAVPASVDMLVFFVLGFLSNFFLGVVNILIRRLVAADLPENEGVGFNSMVNFVVAFLALFGGLAGGALASQGAGFSHMLQLGTTTLGNSYILTFLLAFVLSATGLVLSFRLKEKGSYSPIGAAQILFSLHGIRAFMDIDRLDKATDPIKRKTLLLSLGTNLAGIATSEIRNTLASPFSDDKADVIRGLFDRPRVALVDDLIRDAFDTDSYTQIESIFALGALSHNDKAEKALAFLLENGTIMVRSTAAKSLARVTHDTRYLSRVAQISDLSVNTREELNFLIARNLMDKEGEFFEELFLAAKKGMSVSFRQTRYSVLAHFLNLNPPLAELFEQKNLDNFDSFIDFLDEARDIPDLDSQHDAILSAFEHREWSRVWAICLSMVRGLTVLNPRLQHVYNAVMGCQTMPQVQTDGNDALAVLYFSYHLKKHAEA